MESSNRSHIKFMDQVSGGGFADVSKSFVRKAKTMHTNTMGHTQVQISV